MEVFIYKYASFKIKQIMAWKTIQPQEKLEMLDRVQKAIDACKAGKICIDECMGLLASI